MGIPEEGNLLAWHCRGLRKSKKHSSWIWRLHSGFIGSNRAFHRPGEELAVTSAAGGTEFHNLAVWYHPCGPQYYFCRQPLWIPVSQRLRRRILDQVAQRAERD